MGMEHTTAEQSIAAASRARSLSSAMDKLLTAGWTISRNDSTPSVDAYRFVNPAFPGEVAILEAANRFSNASWVQVHIL